MKTPRTFESVVTELIAGLRSGEITLDAPQNETEASVSHQPTNLSSNNRKSRPSHRSELETKEEKAPGS